MYSKLFTTIILFITSTLLLAQNAKITGNVADKATGETLIGVTVMLQGTPKGASTDLDGNFVIENVNEGNYKLDVSYVGYGKKIIEDVIVKGNETVTVNIGLETQTTALTEVVIVASMKRENVAAILTLQKNSATVSDGISSESIRRSPDKNTGEVIRRVSGVTIQDNKFAVIRGLNDRYNLAMVNGSILPSTEADRKAFSFDLFPSSLIDNIIINKAATPDMPAEFSGGIIQLNTKDIPDENFVNLQVGAGVNTQTQGSAFYTQQKGKLDWLGIDDGSRALPKSLPATKDYQNLDLNSRLELSKNFKNDWAINKSEAMPNHTFQFSTGQVRNWGTRQLGLIAALTYNHNYRTSIIKRADYSAPTIEDYQFDDIQNKENVLAGALLNVGFKFNEHHKISIRSNYNINTDITNTSRVGSIYYDNAMTQATLATFRSNQLLNTQIQSDHYFASKEMRLTVKAGFSDVNRNTPSMRQLPYFRDSDAGSEVPYTASVPSGSASTTNSGRFYSILSEKNYNAGFDFTMPLNMGKMKQNFKVGTMAMLRDRNFDARVLGIIKAKTSKFDSSLKGLDPVAIFDTAHFNINGFVYDEITNANDHYNASATTLAAYAMFDTKFTQKLRAVWGVRAENFNQSLTTGDDSNPYKIDNKKLNILPSINLTYGLNEKTNLRFCASQTLSRPEFRELSRFAFYNFEDRSLDTGSDSLNQTNITNLDLRYELFPSNGQLISVSGFYKHFKNPIERFSYTTGTGSRIRTYANAPSADNLGVELELRKSFDFIKSGSFWKDITFFANAAYIHSAVNIAVASGENTTRPLQGQSPYIMNIGLQYVNNDNGFGSAIMFNQAGNRLIEVGGADYPDIYEAPRGLLDFQVSKKIWKNGELRLTVSDILNQNVQYYQDVNNNKHFNQGTDNNIMTLKPGTTFNVTFAYKL